MIGISSGLGILGAHVPGPMIFLAETITPLQRLQSVPASFWLRVGVAVLALVLLVVIMRKVLKMNKVVLAVVLCIVFSIIGFNWIYDRNEPKWATPVVEKLANFFPTKDSMASPGGPKPAETKPAAPKAPVRK